MISWLLVVYLFFGCQPEENENFPENPDLIFSKAFSININPYSYMDEHGVIYHILGDSGYYRNIPDTVNGTPVISWDTLGINLVTAAIFNSEIKVQEENILNADDIIWQWHKGDSMSGYEGYVNYFDGKQVVNQKIIYEKQPLALENGLYYWGVWGWNDEGTRIWFSSRPLAFYVK